jgi:hypothetical protein
MRHLCHRLLPAITCVLCLSCLPAAAQQSPWGWGTAAPATWSQELVADYLLTGQTPHPAVVRIVAPERSGTSLGSGVLVDINRSQGLVLTNWHVVRDSRSAVLVQFPNGFQTAGTVIRWDEAWDLAAIVIWKPPATPIPIAAAAPTIGEQLTIAGYGRGPYRAETGACTDYLSPATGYAREFVELAATARQGDSGGPILNEKGELAGVLFGQNSGRTIGSCSTRVRTFLASVGSSGFTPTPIAEFSDVRAIDRGLAASEGGGRVRMAAATREDGGIREGTLERSTHVAAPGQSAPPVAIAQAAPGVPPGFQPGFQQGFQPGFQQGFQPGLQPDGPPGQGFTAAGFEPPPGPQEAYGFAPPGISSPAAALPSPAELAAMFDVRTNGRAMLSAAGGLALMFLGLRTIFGGRRRATADRRSLAFHDE